MAKELFKCVRKCWWGPRFERGMKHYPPRKVYDPQSDDPEYNTEWFDPADAWVIESEVLQHFIPVSAISPEDPSADIEYAASISKGVIAPMDPDAVAKQGQISDEALKAQLNSPLIDATKREMIEADAKTGGAK